MTVEFRWDDTEKTILIQRFYGYVDLDNYIGAVNDTGKWLGEVKHPVDLILELQDAQFNWAGFVAGASYANSRVPENQRYVVLVGAKAFVRTMTGIAKRIAPKANQNLYFGNSIDEARKLILSKRE